MPGRICKDFEETVKAGKTPPFRFLPPPLNLCKSLLIFKLPIHFFSKSELILKPNVMMSGFKTFKGTLQSPG